MSKFVKRKAQTMLLAVLIVSATAISVGVTLATASAGEMSSSLKTQDSLQAYALAKSCLDDSLMRMSKQDIVTSTTFTSSQGKCTIKISGSSPYEIESTGTLGRINRHLKAEVTLDQQGELSITNISETY